MESTKYTSFSDFDTLTHKILYRIIRKKFFELSI